MANTLKIKRGLASGIPQGQLAEPLFTTDTYDLYIGKGSGGNQRFQKYIASGTSSQFLKGDGSLDSTAYQATSQKGTANGYASLDSGGKVPVSELPNSIMEYKGTWDASTNTPTLADGTGNAGDVYICSVGGTVNFGAGPITFAAGDWVVYSGSVWQKSINSNAVASVNGYTGAVVLYTDDISEDGSPTNLWFTTARARAALSATSPIQYSTSTGVISVLDASASQAGVVTTGTQTFAGAKTFNSNVTGAAFITPSNSYFQLGYGADAASRSWQIKNDELDPGDLNIMQSTTRTGTTYSTKLRIKPDGIIVFGNGTNSFEASGYGYVDGIFEATTLKKTGGTSSQFLKADGTVDSTTYQAQLNGTGFVKASGTTISYDNSTYLTTSSAASTYLPLSGGSISATSAGYALSITNIEDSSQGLLLRSTDADTTLYLARFQSSASAVSTTWIDRFSIAKNGSVVIGDNAPFTNIRLYVKGSDTTSSNYALNVADSIGADIVWFRNDKAARFYGNVGIGKSPSVALDVVGAGTFSSSVSINSSAVANYDLNIYNTIPRIQLQNPTSGTTTADGMHIYQSGSDSYIINKESANLYLGSANGINLTIASTGAATFSSSVTATDLITINGSSSGRVLKLNSKDNLGDNWIGFYRNDGTRQGYIGYGYSAYDYMELFQEANEPIIFSTNATERMRITSSGDMYLTGRSTNGDYGMYFYSNDSDSRIYSSNSGAVSKNLIFYTSGTERMRITSGGNVGIGTSSPAVSLDVNGKIRLRDGGNTTVPSFQMNAGGTMGLSNPTSEDIAFITSSTERMRITSGGNLSFSAGCNIAMSTTSYIQSYASTGNNYGIVIQNTSNNTSAKCIRFQGWDASETGSISTYVNLTTYTTSSDYRLKEDLQDFSGLDILSKIKMYDFKWKNADWRMYGALAHEVKEIIPYAVTGDKDDKDYQSMDYSILVPVLTKAIQELKAEIDTLKK